MRSQVAHESGRGRDQAALRRNLEAAAAAAGTGGGRAGGGEGRLWNVDRKARREASADGGEGGEDGDARRRSKRRIMAAATDMGGHGDGENGGDVCGAGREGWMQCENKGCRRWARPPPKYWVAVRRAGLRRGGDSGVGLGDCGAVRQGRGRSGEATLEEDKERVQVAEQCGGGDLRVEVSGSGEAGAAEAVEDDEALEDGKGGEEVGGGGRRCGPGMQRGSGRVSAGACRGDSWGGDRPSHADDRGAGDKTPPRRCGREGALSPSDEPGHSGADAGLQGAGGVGAGGCVAGGAPRAAQASPGAPSATGRPVGSGSEAAGGAGGRGGVGGGGVQVPFYCRRRCEAEAEAFAGLL